MTLNEIWPEVRPYIDLLNKRVYKLMGYGMSIWEISVHKHRKYFMPAEVEIFEKYLGILLK